MIFFLEIEDVIWSSFGYWHLNWISTDCELKFKNYSGLEFALNSKEFGNFDLIRCLTLMIREQTT
jgi:hypothetical protein